MNKNVKILKVFNKTYCIIQMKCTIIFMLKSTTQFENSLKIKKNLKKTKPKQSKKKNNYAIHVGFE